MSEREGKKEEEEEQRLDESGGHSQLWGWERDRLAATEASAVEKEEECGGGHSTEPSEATVAALFNHLELVNGTVTLEQVAGRDRDAIRFRNSVIPYDQRVEFLAEAGITPEQWRKLRARELKRRCPESARALPPPPPPDWNILANLTTKEQERWEQLRVEERSSEWLREAAQRVHGVRCWSRELSTGLEHETSACVMLVDAVHCANYGDAAMRFLHEDGCTLENDLVALCHRHHIAKIVLASLTPISFVHRTATPPSAIECASWFAQALYAHVKPRVLLLGTAEIASHLGGHRNTIVGSAYRATRDSAERARWVRECEEAIAQVFPVRVRGTDAFETLYLNAAIRAKTRPPKRSASAPSTSKVTPPSVKKALRHTQPLQNFLRSSASE
jgi:hypothetical protein